MASRVFLDNVDDYLAPSQACVNPLFSGSKTEEDTNDEAETASTAPLLNRVVPRQRRKRRSNGISSALNGSSSSAVPSPPSNSKRDVVQASIADCLACSGCVTTAETVLLEQHQHAVEQLWDMIQNSKNKQLEHGIPRIVLTVSPASWADLLRQFGVQVDSTSHLLQYQRQLVTLLHETLSVSVVLDGNVPLESCRQAAVQEFCQAYRQKYNQTDDAMDVEPNESDRLEGTVPSRALSCEETQYYDGNSTRTVQHSNNGPRLRQALPILSSSCPALVCLIETSVANAVHHLSTIKSPMAAAGAVLKNDVSQDESQFYHVAVMPCHDKKLEASRLDFSSTTLSSNNKDTVKDVDMVLTTGECWDLVRRAILTETDNDDNDDAKKNMMRQQLVSRPLAPTVCPVDWQQQQQQADRQRRSVENGAAISTAPLLVVSSAERRQAPTDDDTFSVGDSDSSGFFAFGSGGYAESLFVAAAKKLFDVTIRRVVWKPVVNMPSATTKTVVNARPPQQQSARVAHRRRDLYQAVLYRRFDGSYSCQNDNDPTAQPVLKFAIAYGMQTLQRILAPFSNDESPPYDYIEAMACPSGCLNGGGQIRVSERETPTETKLRVAQTRRLFVPLPSTTSTSPLDVERLYTRYHVVPPLQHSLGATAGVAVKDMQW